MAFRALARDAFCLVFFLFVPAYFASKAQNELLDFSPLTLAEDEKSISPIPRPSPAYHALCRRTRGNDGAATMHTSRPRVIALKSCWTICVGHWSDLWKTILNVCFTILTGFSVLLQIPGTSGDPLARFFVFMAILRLLPALSSAAILLHYFDKKHFRSGNFAIIWYQHVERHRQSCLYMPWTIVALPAIALSWGAIFMIVAVFLSVWGEGMDPTLPSVEERSYLTIMSLRTVISVMSAVDVGCIWWLVVKLQAFDEAIKAAHTPAA